MSAVKKWFMAIRPNSLLLSSASVILGTGLALGDGVVHWPTALVCLLGAWLLHILVNLANDLGDFEKGVDQKGEFDPMRQILVGEISQIEMRQAIRIVLLLLVLPSIYLIFRAGWPIGLIAIFAIFAAVFYTIGKRPLGYRGLGDLLVLIFFGPASVAGTYYAQSLEMNLAVFLAGFAPGLFAVGVLTINNVRDYDKDKRAGKDTLVVRFGKLYGKIQYLAAIVVSALIPVVIYGLIHDRKKIMFASLVCFLGAPIIKAVFAHKDRPSMDQAIGMTVMLCLIYCVVFSVGWFF